MFYESENKAIDIGILTMYIDTIILILQWDIASIVAIELTMSKKHNALFQANWTNNAKSLNKEKPQVAGNGLTSPDAFNLGLSIPSSNMLFYLLSFLVNVSLNHFSLSWAAL